MHGFRCQGANERRAKGGRFHGYDQQGIRPVCQRKIQALAAGPGYAVGLCGGRLDLHHRTGAAQPLPERRHGPGRRGKRRVHDPDFRRRPAHRAGAV